VRLDLVRAEVATAARRLAREGLLIGTAGNVSARIPDSDLVAVTATGVVLADCDVEHVSVVDGAGDVVAGELAPTSELDLHLAVYAATGTGAVVHTHAPHGTAVACVEDILPVLHYQQILLGGELRVAPYATFGTPELAAAVTTALTDRQAALMANHGTVAIGSTLAKALDNALLLEWLCALHLRAHALGTPRVLDEQQQVEVITQALGLGYGSTQKIQKKVHH
jgi:L-fuculose-phosphate aldolase